MVFLLKSTNEKTPQTLHTNFVESQFLMRCLKRLFYDSSEKLYPLDPSDSAKGGIDNEKHQRKSKSEADEPERSLTDSGDSGDDDNEHPDDPADPLVGKPEWEPEHVGAEDSDAGDCNEPVGLLVAGIV